MRPGDTSWRYILRCLGELKEDDWITSKEFGNLFSVPVRIVTNHFKKLRKYSLIVRQPDIDARSVRGGNHYKYQLSASGKKKMEYWKKYKDSIDFDRNKIKCPRCDFQINIAELKFLCGLNINEKGGDKS